MSRVLFYRHSIPTIPSHCCFYTCYIIICTVVYGSHYRCLKTANILATTGSTTVYAASPTVRIRNMLPAFALLLLTYTYLPTGSYAAATMSFSWSAAVCSNTYLLGTCGIVPFATVTSLCLCRARNWIWALVTTPKSAKQNTSNKRLHLR